VHAPLIRQPRILRGNGVVIGPAIRQQRIRQLSMKPVSYPHPIKPDNEMERDDILSQNCSLPLSSNVLVSAQQVKGNHTVMSFTLIICRLG
jgi:hypothetical protein